MNNYFIEYEVLKPSDLSGKKRELRVYKKTPITALNEFHRRMQRTKEVDGKRKIIRPRLRSHEYKISRLFIRYTDSAKDLESGRTIESTFDLPKTANPDLKFQTKRIKKTDTVSKKTTTGPEFPFMADVPAVSK